jgi:hypothetical protein
MAIVQNPIIGRAKNSMGNATFSTWMGKNVVKAKAISVGNPRTPAQQRQRLKFGAIQVLSKVAGAKAKKKFVYNNHMTEPNMFMQSNLPNLVVSPSGTVSFDMPGMVFSRGSLGGDTLTGISSPTPGVIDVTFSGTSNGSSKLATDFAQVGIVNGDTGEYEETNIVFSRNSNHATVNYPTSWAGITCHAYLFFRRPSQQQASNSQYAGIVVAS